MNISRNRIRFRAVQTVSDDFTARFRPHRNRAAELPATGTASEESPQGQEQNDPGDRQARKKQIPLEVEDLDSARSAGNSRFAELVDDADSSLLIERVIKRPFDQHRC